MALSSWKVYKTSEAEEIFKAFKADAVPPWECEHNNQAQIM